MNGKTLRQIIKNSGLEMKEVADRVKLTPQALQNRLKAESVKSDFLKQIALSINKNMNQLLQEAEEIENPPKVMPDRNARMLGNPVDLHITKGGTHFVELSEGQYVMFPHIVTVKARAGFIGGGYGDPEFIDSLPSQAVIVDQIHRGHYLWFVIDGDSMNDGTIEKAIPHGTKVLAREIKMDLWRSRFHYNEYSSFVIVHRTDGILCKEIIAHDVERGIITCHSLNPNRVMYPDFDLKLDECLQIFNVVRRDVA